MLHGFKIEARMKFNLNQLKSKWQMLSAKRKKENIFYGMK